MPLIGSSSRASSSQVSQGQGFSEIAGPATAINLNISAGKKSSVNPIINLTDQGAVRAAQGIAERSVQQVETLGVGLADLIGQAFSASQAATSQAIGAAVESQRGEVENLGLAVAKWGALAAAVYFAARAFGKG